MDIAKGYWRSYWVWRRGTFVRYPIDALDSLFDELGEQSAESVILM